MIAMRGEHVALLEPFDAPGRTSEEMAWGVIGRATLRVRGIDVNGGEYLLGVAAATMLAAPRPDGTRRHGAACCLRLLPNRSAASCPNTRTSLPGCCR